jgi:hypothetical protein
MLSHSTTWHGLAALRRVVFAGRAESLASRSAVRYLTGADGRRTRSDFDRYIGRPAAQRT